MNQLLRLTVAIPLFFSAGQVFAQSRKSVAEHKERLPKVAVNFVNIFADKFPNAFKGIHILEEFMRRTQRKRD